SDGAKDPKDVVWQPLQIEKDDTRGLQTPGMVRFLWPGTLQPLPEPATIEVEGTETRIRLLDAKSAARYQAGDSIAIFQEPDAELAVVSAVRADTLILREPLEKRFTNPQVAFAPAARFGTPRFWVRVVWPTGRHPEPQSAERVRVRGVYLNAALAEQVRTQTD